MLCVCLVLKTFAKVREVTALERKLKHGTNSTTITGKCCFIALHDVICLEIFELGSLASC